MALGGAIAARREIDLVDIVRDAHSPWALPEHYHWVLRRPMLLLRPVKRKGSLGLTFGRPPQGRFGRHGDPARVTDKARLAT